MRVGGGVGVSVNECSCAHHVTWSPNKFWRSTSIFNLWHERSIPVNSYCTSASQERCCIVAGMYYRIFFAVVLFGSKPLSPSAITAPSSLRGTTWTADLKCREVKTGFCRDSHWLEIWKNHSMGPNGGGVAMDSDLSLCGSYTAACALPGEREGGAK